MPTSTRLQPETYEALKAAAEGAGMTVSEWVRREIAFSVERGHRLKLEPHGPRQVSFNLDRPTLAAVRKLSGGQISKWVRRVIATGIKLDAGQHISIVGTPAVNTIYTQSTPTP